MNAQPQHAQFQRRVYLDAMASSPLDPRVKEVVCEAFDRYPANPGSLHQEGREARKALDRAREKVARAVDALPTDVIFTSGGSEGNTHALHGLARALQREGRNLSEVAVAILDIEHASVAEAAQALAYEGVTVHHLPVDGEGMIVMEALERVLQDPRLILVSVVAVNNEVGAIQPLREITRRVAAERRRRQDRFPLVHSDASQAPAVMRVSLKEWGVDALTIDAQKLYGPKGIGALVRARSYPLAPLVYGGAQEFGLRGGTPNVPLIVGFAEAMVLCNAQRDARVQHLSRLGRQFLEETLRAIPETVLNGPPPGPHRAATNINLSFLGVEGEYVVLGLDAKGIAASTRSACHLPGGGMGSEVVFALAKDRERAKSAVRFSLHPWLAAEDISYTVCALRDVVAQGRGALAHGAA
ncbi:MAG: cysteine desulfurase IscS [Candidatus Parcubacteria bacterium]|nr:MAG: cysteine desulfurase IscS [Candidatus Parcubacteria bacterium]